MNSFMLAWENFRHDGKSANGKLLHWTRILLIFFLLSLTLTSNSVQRYLEHNLQSLLGADLVVSRYQPLSDEQLEVLGAHGNALSVTRQLEVTLTNGGLWQRVQLKAADDAYPLQGNLVIAHELGGEPRTRHSGPPPGEIWVGARLFSKLELIVGQTLEVGGTALTLTAILEHEPDRLMEGHSVAMRAMVHESTSIDGSLDAGRILYRYLFAADQAQQSLLAQWVETEVPDAQVIGRERGGHPLALFWRRVENFIGLASVLLFFMASIAVDTAGRRQLKEQQFRLAVGMSMGLRMAQGLSVSLVQWIMSLICSLIPAVILAYVAQYLILRQLDGQFPGIEPGLHLAAAAKTCLLLTALLLCFHLPQLIQLKNTSVISLIRQQEQSRSVVVRLLWTLAILAVLAAIYSDNMLLTAMTLGAMLSSLLLMMLVTWLFLTAGERLSRPLAGLLPFSLFMMKQRLLSKSTQVLGLGLCALLLLFTLMLMKDLGAAMERSSRTHDGNLLITEADQAQVRTLRDWSAKTGSVIRQQRPFTRAQLVRINGAALPSLSEKPSESLARLMRPVRLSWSERVPENNTLNKGQWWAPGSGNWGQISVESEVLTDTGIRIGDTLSFMIGRQVYEFNVVASHGFAPGAGSITFWFQVPPAMVAIVEPEVRYMGSMELPQAAWSELPGLWRAHPTLTLVPLRELTERFDRTLAMVSKLVFGFSGMIILMALVVITASVNGFEQDDRKKNGLLMSMGLVKKDCLILSFYEWIITAVIAAVGAIGGTWVAGHLIYQSQFSIPYQPDPVWVLSTLAVTGAIVCGVGLLLCRNSLRTSVVFLLNE